VLERLRRMRGVKEALELVVAHPDAPTIWQTTWSRFAQDHDWTLSLHHDRHLAVCMGLHGKLGQRSPLRGLDATVLYMILIDTVSIPLTAHSMLAALQEGEPAGRRAIMEKDTEGWPETKTNAGAGGSRS